MLAEHIAERSVSVGNYVAVGQLMTIVPLNLFVAASSHTCAHSSPCGKSNASRGISYRKAVLVARRALRCR